MTQDEYNKLRAMRVQETFQMDPQVKMNLKGQDLILEFNNLAIINLYKEIGLNLLDKGFTSEDWDNPVTLGNLFYFGLKANHPDMTFELANSYMTYRHYAYILANIRTALSLFLPDMSDSRVDPVKEEEPTKAQDPISQPMRVG